MKLPKEKSAAAAREATRRLENPLTKVQKAEKAAVDADRLLFLNFFGLVVIDPCFFIIWWV